MKNLKKILALVLVLAMAVSVVACSSGTPDSSSTPDTTPTSSSTPEDSTPADDSGSDAAEPYKITISTQMSEAAEAGWKAVADGYKKHHPEAEVVVDLKPGDSYSDWVKGIAADYMSSEVDIVAINLVNERTSDMVVNWNEYMEETNPYDAEGKPWKETFSYESQVRSPTDGSFDALSLFSVQVKWFYNADIFEECGVEAPKTWDELVDICEKIDAKGYQPICIEGSYDSFYAMRMGWLSQMYADQTTRSTVEVVRAQPGDYCYDPDVDGKFELDVTDPWNDDTTNYTVNDVRFWAAVKDGTLSANTPGTVAVWENFKKVFPKYAGGDAFFGTLDGLPAFYQGKAAMTVHVGGFAIAFENTMKKAEAGEEVTTKDADGNDVAIEGIKRFKLGAFNMPSMTNESGKWGVDEVFQAPVRTIEVPTGFLGAFNRSAEHTAQVVDFMMYYCSAEGMSLYLNAMLGAQGSVDGPCLVYGVEYPADIAAAFEDTEFIGNCQKGRGQAFARGIADNQESTRKFYDLAQQCLKGEITCEQYAEEMAKQHLSYFDQVLPKSIALSDLENPANEPVGNEAEDDEG